MSQSIKYAEKIDSLHIRMARAGLGITVRELAALTGTNKATIVRMEAGNTVRDSTLAHVRQTLESMGAEFFEFEETNKITVGIKYTQPDQNTVTVSN